MDENIPGSEVSTESEPLVEPVVTVAAAVAAVTQPVTVASMVTLDTLSASVSFISSAPQSAQTTKDPLTTPYTLNNQTSTVTLDDKLKDYCAVLIKEFTRNFPCSNVIRLYPLMKENQA